MGIPGEPKQRSFPVGRFKHCTVILTKDCTLANIKGVQAGCLLPPSPEAGSRCTTARGSKQGTTAISAPENASPTEL